MASIREAIIHTQVNYGEQDTRYILDNRKKMNNMLQEYSCSAQLIEGSNNALVVSHCTPEEYELTLKILVCHFDMKFNRKLKLHPVPTPEPVTAVIELDESTHQYVKCNIDSLNQKLVYECFNVSISLSEGCDLQISGPDNATIEMAFKFLRGRLENLYNNNISVSNHLPANASQYQHTTVPPAQTEPTQSPNSSQESVDFCMKKWIIPDTLYDACQSKIESIFNSHDYTYSVQSTETQNVIIEYEGSHGVIELIKSELENVRKQYSALSPPSNISDYSSAPSDPQSYISYQEDLDPSDVSLPPSPSPSPSPGDTRPELAQTEQLDFIQCVNSLQITNPFYFDLHPNAAGAEKSRPEKQKSSSNPGFNNFPPMEPYTPAPEPMPPTEPPVRLPVQNESDYLRSSEIDNYTKQSHSLPPASQQSPTHPHTSSSGRCRNRIKENSLTEAMKVAPMPSSEPRVSTSSFNDPQVVSRLASMHLQDTDKQQQPQQQQQQQQQGISSDTQQDRFSHQSLEAIIRYHDKFASVVRLPAEGSFQEASSLESSMLNVRFIQCRDRPRVCTVIADDKEMVLYALKELSKKFGKLGYLPGCNGIPVTSQGTSCFVELDDKPKETQKTKLLASLTCSSGMSIKIKYMNFYDGKWNAVVRSVEPNTISSTRLENVDILAVLGPNIGPADGKYLADRAERLEYWCYYDARSKQGFCEHILYLVIPGWNPNDFKANDLKESIASILNYCNRQGFASVAFPIIGHESKHIPIPLSAQALLRAIDEFSSRCPSPSLKQVDIVITKESCIRAFQYHFITPIQRHLREHSRVKKCMTSETAQEEEEERCPICLEELYTEGQGVRELVQCKHKFHDLCISTAIESKPRCPLCMSALGVQRGDQPPGGRMVHTVLFSPLPGYPHHGTIKIHYDIPGGTQTEYHPSPGAPYPSTSRSAYLPNNQQGQKVLELLKIAFDRGLIFTIGTSRTLGVDNVITWNDIHHKTMQTGQAHGYPDPGYLERVSAELKDKGVE